jgi:hypothetical protein
MQRQHINFEKFCYFRSPNWRYNRVLEIQEYGRLHGHAGHLSVSDDAETKAIFKFKKQLDGSQPDSPARTRIIYQNLGHYLAYQFHEKRHDAVGITSVATLEARILSGATDQEIAADFGTLPDMPKWYEATYFNVRDRLKCHDWILNFVLMPSVRAHLGIQQPGEAPVSAPFFDVTLKFFAYYGGSIILDRVLSGFRRNDHATAYEDESAWITNQTNMRLKQIMAAATTTLTVNKYNITELMHVYARILEIEKSNATPAAKGDQFLRAMGSMLVELPFCVGDAGAKQVENTAIQVYDDSAAELRDNEIMLVSADRKPASVQHVEKLTMPPPRRRPDQESKNDQNIK